VLGLDVDNDSVFINHMLVDYCRDHKIELTRSRAYKKNDQASIEQKNGAVIRRMVAWGRLEGAEAVAALNKLYASFVPAFFQTALQDTPGRQGNQELTPATDLLRTATGTKRFLTNRWSNYGQRSRLWI